MMRVYSSHQTTSRLGMPLSCPLGLPKPVTMRRAYKTYSIEEAVCTP